jgi:hypothetical protein
LRPSRFGFEDFDTVPDWFLSVFIWYGINTVMKRLETNYYTCQSKNDSQLNHQLSAWIARHHGEFTHAITFTFDERRVWHFIRASKQMTTPHDERMIELLRKTMFLFKRRIDRALYGNISKRHGTRLLFIPVLEGLSVGQFPHYHAVMSVDTERSRQLSDVVKSTWVKLPFAGHQIELVPYRDQGWLSYITKGVLNLNQHSVDWESVSIPSRSLATC